MPKPTLPDVWLTIQDGALGILPPNTDNISAKIGVASAGPFNTPTTVRDLKTLRDTFGGGPMVEAAATHIAISGAPVTLVRGNPSTAATVSAVTSVKTGSGTLATTGSTPLDRFDVIVVITRAGNLGAAGFKYSLDGGDNYSAEIAVPVGGSYVVPGSGLTLVFGGTAFAVNDTYSFTTTAPAMTLSDVNTSLDALFANPNEWAWVHIVGETTATVAAGVDTKMSLAENNFRFAFAMLETRDINSVTDSGSAATWRNNIATEWANFASLRVDVEAGHEELTSPLTGRVHRRPVAWATSGRLAKIPAHEHAGRVASASLPGVISLYHDEFVTQGLDALGFTTHRTFIGRTGFYVTNGRIKAPQGSDFQYIENRRVVDKGCRIARNAALTFLNDDVLVDDAGNIDEVEARKIEAFVEGQLIAGLVSEGNASDVSVQIDRASNILSTRSTRLTVRIRPKGYLSFIEVDIGLTNPKFDQFLNGGA